MSPLLNSYLDDKNKVTFKDLTEDQISILDGTIPSNKLKSVDSLKLGVGITAMSPAAKYPIERLVEVFGLNGYVVDFDIKSEPIVVKQTNGTVNMTQCVCTLEFYAPEYGIYRKVTGGSQHKDAGDAAKGSITDCYTSLLAELSQGFRDIWYNKYDADGNYHENGVPKTPKKEDKAQL